MGEGRINIKDRNKSGQSKQPNLWENPNLNPIPRLKSAMQQALKDSPLSRNEVIDAINKIAAIEGLTTGGRAQRVTLAQLDKWVAPGTRQHLIPLKYLPLFCHVTGSLLPLQALVQPLGATVMGETEAKRLAWAEVEIERRQLAKKAKRLSEEVGL